VIQRLKTFSSVFLTAIYGFIIAFTAIPSDQARAADILPSNDKGFEDYSTQHFYHTAPIESSISFFSGVPNSGFKNSFFDFYAVSTFTEQILLSEFTQYQSHFDNVLINQRKSDLIFPFHYFW